MSELSHKNALEDAILSSEGRKASDTQGENTVQTAIGKTEIDSKMDIEEIKLTKTSVL